MKVNFKLVEFLLLPLFLMPIGLYAQQSNAAKQEQPSYIKEWKIRPIGLLFSSVGAAGEFQIQKNVSIEVNAIYNWGGLITPFFTEPDGKVLALNCNARYYINDSEKRLDRFYAGSYVNLVSDRSKFSSISSNYGSLGFLAGYKIISKDGKVTFDFNAGIGRVLVGVDGVDIPLDGLGSIMIGYRF